MERRRRDNREQDLPLHRKYRPRTLKQVLGQDGIVKSLSSVLKENKAHSFLFSGNSGVGKTTLARIIATEVGCDKNNLLEIDAATHTGIDDMRQLCEGLKYAAVGDNPIKFIILDECFAKDTLITTDSGTTVIEDIKIGDPIINIEGNAKVQNVFKNEISLSRVVQVHVGKKSIICSEDHKFLTDTGWVSAIDLKGCLTFSSFLGYNKGNSNSLKRQENEKTSIKRNEREFSIQNTSKNPPQYLQRVWKDFSSKNMESNSMRYVLLYRQCLCDLWHKSQACMESNKSNVFSKMWQYFGGFQTNWNPFRKESKKSTVRDFAFEKEKSRFMERSFRKIFKKNEEEKSYVKSKNNRKDDKYKTVKWNSWLGGQSWWQWQVHRISSTFGSCFMLAYGGGCGDGTQSFRQEWLPTCLQIGHREQEAEVGDRSGREWTQLEQSYIERQKKRGKTGSVRVESVEIYQPGSNDKSFESVIGDKERNQGFVEFYDLGIDGHPSYYANNVLVHNCHSLSKKAWDSLLKIIEEPPKHVFFAFCTTELEKVPKTIQTRCHAYHLKDVRRDDLLDLMDFVCAEEKITLPEGADDLIVHESYGSPRKALIYLSECRGCETKAEVASILETAEDSTQVIDLCRVLLDNKSTWEDAFNIIKSMKDQNPESVRIQICTYINACIMRSRSSRDVPRLLSLLDIFSKPIYTPTGMSEIFLALGDIYFQN